MKSSLLSESERLFRFLEKFFNLEAPKVKRHRIESKDGHITINGEFKSLTINGKRAVLK